MRRIPLEPNLQTIGERLTYLRRLRGFKTRRAAMDALGLPDQYNQHENGHSTPGLENALLYAERYNAPLDWILSGKIRRGFGVPVRGTVQAGDDGAEIAPDDGGEYVDAPDGISADAVAFRVFGRSMEPIYHHGDLLFAERQVDDPSTLVGRDAVCHTGNDHRHIKRIAAVNLEGVYRLESHNPTYPAIERQLKAAAPIVWVRRAQN
ncbi:MAG: S24 family peptidase [Pseudomonadota bacterium]